MKKHITIFLAVSLTVISACTKDKICSPVNSACRWDESIFALTDTVPDTFSSCRATIFDPYTYLLNRYDYLDPCFNPNNPNEFCFIQKDIRNYVRKVCSYNFCTGNFKVIAPNAFRNTTWSSKDWIAFTGEDGHIWKVKSNGDSLQRMTTPLAGGPCYYPFWNPSGNALFFYEQGSGFHSIISETGEYLDTIFNAWGNFYEWNERGILCSRGVSGVAQITLLDPVSKSYNLLFTHSQTDYDTVHPENFMIGACFDKRNNNVVLTTFYNIITKTISGQTITNTYLNAPTKRFQEIPTCANGKVITVRENRWVVSPYCDLGLKTDLYIMNTDGSEYHKILLPQE